MKMRLFSILSVIIFMSSCSKNNDLNNNEESVKLIQALSSDRSGSSIDSLFYNDQRKLVSKKEYLYFKNKYILDYEHVYTYDSNDRLVRISRTHASSDIPSEEFIYEYYANGDLKNRKHKNYYGVSEKSFSYEAGKIIVDQGKTSEIRILLDANNRITAAERKNPQTNTFYKFKEYQYNDNGNIEELSIKYGLYEGITYFFEYDNKTNPFVVFDFELPNSLSIKKIEAVFSHSNYPFVTIGDNDNYFGFLNKNNVISYTHSNAHDGKYTYSYDENDEYPMSIRYDFLNDPYALLIDYWE